MPPCKGVLSRYIISGKIYNLWQVAMFPELPEALHGYHE
jgi:hypothetical protein